MTKILKLSLPMVATAALLGVGGCATEGLGNADYSRTQARGEQHIRAGVVEYVRPVKIEGTNTGVGAMAGASLGGLAASEIGQGTGSIAAAIGGAVLGAVAGQMAEAALTKEEGLEITVELDSGKKIAVTQAADEMFRVGDRVRILGNGETTRVTHENR
ncbi:Outer membrane lipoprotein pcp [Gammaproteobacteria bacterium]